MNDFKPNIKLELVKLWSELDAKHIKVIKLVVSRESNDRSEVHFFDLDRLLQSAGSSDDLTEQNFESLFHNLTKREQEILIYVAKGSTSIEISEKFYISVNTVKNHRRNIKMKLQLGDSVEYSRFLRWVCLKIK